MNQKPSYYAIVPSNVRYDEDLKAAEKLLYAEITALANTAGYCFATNAYFAKLYNVHKNSVCRWIGNLIKKGYLHSEIICDENKVVVERRLYLNDSIAINNIKPINNNGDTPINKKDGTPINNNEDTPINENGEDNTTSINTTSINNIYSQIYEHWNDKQIKVHKKLSTNIKKSIDKALKEYTLDEIVTAIDNYEKIYKDDYYYTWTWSLEKFLKQGNGISRFMVDGDLFINYSNYKSKNKSNSDWSEESEIYNFGSEEDRADDKPKQTEQVDF